MGQRPEFEYTNTLSEVERTRQNLIDIIAEKGQVSQDGFILSVADYNRAPNIKLLKQIATSMRQWLERDQELKDYQDTKIAVAEFSGDVLAAMLASEMDLPLVLIKKGAPSRAMTGQVVVGNAYPITRNGEPVPMAVEARHFRDSRVIFIDDFMATRSTAHTAINMIRSAGGVPIAVCNGIYKANQARASESFNIPTLNLIEIEELKPETDSNFALVKIKDLNNPITLKTPWDQQWQPQ